MNFGWGWGWRCRQQIQESGSYTTTLPFSSCFPAEALFSVYLKPLLFCRLNFPFSVLHVPFFPEALRLVLWLLIPVSSFLSRCFSGEAEWLRLNPGLLVAERLRGGRGAAGGAGPPAVCDVGRLFSLPEICADEIILTCSLISASLGNLVAFLRGPG